MTPQITVTYPALNEKSKPLIQGWTLPFLVKYATQMAPNAANSQVITNENSVSIERTSPTVFADEFGSSTSKGDNALTLASLALKAGGVR